MNIHSIIAVIYLFSLAVAQPQSGQISHSGQVGTGTGTGESGEGAEMSDVNRLVQSLKNMGVKPGPAIRAAHDLIFGRGYTMIKKTEYHNFNARYGNPNVPQNEPVNAASGDVDPDYNSPEDVHPDGDSPKDVDPDDGSPKAGTVGLLVAQGIYTDVDESPHNNKKGDLLAIQETSFAGISLLAAGDCCKVDSDCTTQDSQNCPIYCDTTVDPWCTNNKKGVCAFTTDTCGACAHCTASGECLPEVCGNGCDGNPMDCDSVTGCPAVPSAQTCADAMDNQLMIDDFSDPAASSGGSNHEWTDNAVPGFYQDYFQQSGKIMGNQRDTKLVKTDTSGDHVYTHTSKINLGIGSPEDGEWFFTYDGDSESDNPNAGPESDAENLVYKPLDTTEFACPYQSDAQTGIIFKFQDDIASTMCMQQECPDGYYPYYGVEITLTQSGGAGECSQTLEPSGVVGPTLYDVGGGMYFWITTFTTETQLMNFKFADFSCTGGSIDSTTTIGRVKLHMDMGGVRITGLDSMLEVLKTGCCTIDSECDYSCDNALTYTGEGVDKTFKCLPSLI